MTDLLDDLHHAAGPVECLGLTFPNDAARRTHFLAILREQLQDPAFRQIEGFPIGSDEDILALSDPPYYTACPNPFIEEFIRRYGTPYDPAAPYHKEPFAADVSEGKNDPIYNAHSYHTKVPHKAIMRYILHYTQPGDLVFDGFCGTGMTGVAAQLCGDRKAMESLGYRVEKDGAVLEPVQENGQTVWKPFSRLGARRAILNDLSPAATFIAYNYNTPVDVAAFEREAKRILAEVEAECGWMYETRHGNGKTRGRINYTVWSDVFTCPECAGEVVFWDAAVDKDAGQVRDEFPCPHCAKQLTKRNMERAWVTKFDTAIQQTIRQAKQTPVLINYSVGTKRFEKTPDTFDLALIEKIEGMEIPYWFPTNHLPDGYNTRQPMDSHGATYVHHFYTRRNLKILSAFRFFGSRFWAPFSALTPRATRMHRIAASRIGGEKKGVGGATVGVINGTLYIPSLSVEMNVIEQAVERINVFSKSIFKPKITLNITQSTTNLVQLQNNYIDYIFIDPPFGANLMYSEINFLWEGWLKVFTNNQTEAIENKVQGKTLNDYRRLMTDCFKEAFRILKPGRWMTIEFSNTQAAVWNAIQTAIQEAGFIVANVAALDKKQGSFKAVTTTTAVKQDLVISAYKPNGGLEERFTQTGGTEKSVWDFVSTHLNYLPTVKLNNGQLDYIAERDPRILFDRMVAWFIRHGCPVPLSSPEFQAGLQERFPVRDGMIFLPEQLNDYDRARMHAAHAPQMELFVSDERSAIDWLTGFLKQRPATYQDIHPDFMQQLGAGWKKHETRPELKQLLDDNFLQDATNRWYVPDPNKAQELEKLRTKALLKEFALYQAHTGRQLKEFRTEALRAGFKAAYDARDYRAIVGVAAKLPDAVLQEDEKLLMYYDVASMRLEEE
ncbi:MAG: DNA methyltransferase [Candidatus Competibacteraceae bacterium]